MIGDPLQWLFEVAVHAVATFTAAVLSHPAIERACAKIMVRGMTDFFLEAPETAKLDQARNAGEDFPKLVGKFFEGMFLPNKKKQQQQEHSSANASTTEDDTKSEHSIERYEIVVPKTSFNPSRKRINSATT